MPTTIIDVTRRAAMATIAAAFATWSQHGFTRDLAVIVHKDPSCGCCTGWVGHLRNAGFVVTVREATDLNVVRARLGVPPGLAACHTAEVSGYVVEGHVPAEAIRRLIETKPAAIGLAAPGMPMGSPGMEGGPLDTYDVVVFDSHGHRPFMRFRGADSVG